MSCEHVDRWLDDGRPAAGAPEARAHAATCARCARALAADASLDTLLEAAVPPAPAGLTDRVMARIAIAETARGAVPVVAEPPSFPWWAEAAAEPACSLALVLAALLAWQAGPWGLRAPAITERALAWLSAAGSLLAIRLPAAVPPTALALALLPAALLLAIPLYSAAERRAAALASHTAP